MAKLSVPSKHKQVTTHLNPAQTRTVLKWNAKLQPDVWSDWKQIFLDQRIVDFRGHSARKSGSYQYTTDHNLISGCTFNTEDTGNYYSFSRLYGQISTETKGLFAILDRGLFPNGVTEDPRNLTWNIGGSLNYSYWPGIYNRLAHKIRSDMSEPIVDMGMIVGESVQTIRSASSICRDLLDILKFVKRGDVLGAVKIAFGNTNVVAMNNRRSGPVRQFIRAKHPNKYGKRPGKWMFVDRSGTARTKAELRAMHPAKRWLEYSFGVAPTVSDIQDLATLHFGNYNIPPLRWAARFEHESSDVKFTHRMVCKARLTDPLARYRQQLGTHAKQAYALAWELVPLSWLIDYAIDIGGMLSMLSSTVGLTYFDASWSVKMESNDMLVMGAGASGGNGSYGFTCKQKFNFYEREALYSFPIPTRPKILKVLDSGKQQANLLAFITMAFSGHGRSRVANLG